MRGLSVDSSLTKKEFPDHRSFVGNLGKVYTKEDIVREVWGEDYLNGSISVPTYNQAHTAEDRSRPRQTHLHSNRVPSRLPSGEHNPPTAPSD